MVGAVSPEPHRSHPRRVFWTVVLVLLALAAAAAWALLPRSLGDVRIDQVRLLPAGTPDGGHKPAFLATPVRFAVTFVVPKDLEAVRTRLGLDYIAAQLTDCRDRSANAQEVVVQGAGYLGDYGRVRRLGSGPNSRYRAVFDDELTKTVDHRTRRSSARVTPGGLCFSLYGARMWFGHAGSRAIALGTLSG